MLNTGFWLIGIGIIWYIVSAVIYNHFFRKYNPDIYQASKHSKQASKHSKKVTVFVTSGQTPVWVVLFGIPPIPLLLIGIVITIVALIIY